MFSNSAVFGIAIFLFLFPGFPDAQMVENYGQCIAPNGESSLCITLSGCKVIMDMLRQPSLPEDQKSFVKRSQCGYKNGNILVCCPKQNFNTRSAHVSNVDESNQIVNYGRCTTPKGEPASCIILEQCPVINDLVKKGSWSRDEKSYIRRSQCGYRSGNILICCPKEQITSYGSCVTPKGERASCVKLNNCAPITNLMKKNHLSAEDRTFIRSSQCGYTDGTALVCCSGILTSAEANAALPEPGVCGNVISDRIFGGNITQIDEYTWIGLIEYLKRGVERGHHCGASLISKRYVLTAAHCLLPNRIDWQPISVRLGEWDISTEKDCVEDTQGFVNCAKPYIDIEIDRAIPHENYRQSSRSRINDIGLIRLAESVAYTEFIRPICLPLNENIKRNNFDGTYMNVAGWGRIENDTLSNVKLKAGVPIYPFIDCKRFYNKFRIHLQNTQVCAGGELGIDSCQGDSGGPLIGVDISDEETPYSFIYGIVSFGTSPCGKGPGVYTKVHEYTDWIINNMKKIEGVL